MSTIETTSATLDELTARFAQIRAEVNEVIERRNNLFVTTQAELIAAGIDAAIVPGHALSAGDVVMVWDQYTTLTDGRPGWHRVSATHRWSEYRLADDDRWGVYEYGCQAHLCRGVYEVLVVDGAAALVAKAQGMDEEPGHKKAVGRLRRLARSENMRVSVRDRAVTLISPMNDVVHEGDVNSAALWLLGVDPSTCREEDDVLEK